MQTKTYNKIITFVILLFVFVGMSSMSYLNNSKDDKKKKPWVVPEKSKTIKNPVKSDDVDIAFGKALYSKHCKSCHGVKGLGDGPKSKELDTPCGDFTEKEFVAQTDGEIFYKTKEGRDDMPSFKKKLPEDNDIWTIVNYVRSLADKEVNKKAEPVQLQPKKNTANTDTTKTGTAKTGTVKTGPVKVDTAKNNSIKKEQLDQTLKLKVIYQMGSAKVNVWENKKQGESGEYIIRSFEIEKARKENDKSDTKNYFNEIELLQLKAVIDKVINEEAVNIKEDIEKEKE